MKDLGKESLYLKLHRRLKFQPCWEAVLWYNCTVLFCRWNHIFSSSFFSLVGVFCLFPHRLWPLAGGASLKYLQEKPHHYHMPGPGNLSQVHWGALGTAEGAWCKPGSGEWWATSAALSSCFGVSVCGVRQGRHYEFRSVRISLEVGSWEAVNWNNAFF